MLLDYYSMLYTPAPPSGDLIVASYFKMYLIGMATSRYTRSGALDSTTNYALQTNGGVASASSYVAGYQPAFINDGYKSIPAGGFTGNGFWNDNTNGSFPDWCQVTFPTAKTVGRVEVYGYDAGTGYPNNYVVQVDDGAGGWTSVGSYNSANGVFHNSFSFTPVSTIAVRVTVYDADRSDGNTASFYYSRIVEVEAYSA